MNEQLGNFFEALKATDIGTKMVVGISAVALVGAIAVVGSISGKEHFEVAFSGLSNAQFAAVSAAIAQAGIDMETYRSDGQSSILTRKGDVYRAKGAAFLAGAISAQEKGILGSAGGASNIFAGADEREQLTREKEMSEIEKTIEACDFIARAELIFPRASPTALRSAKKESVSMVVHTRGKHELTAEQSQTLSLLLRGALDIPMDKIIITDQAGRLIHGGETEDASKFDGRTFEMQREYNLAEEKRINNHLAATLGIDKARVVVTSEFDFVQSTVVSRRAEEPVMISERKILTDTPAGSSGPGEGGGFAGASSNVASSSTAWGTDDTAVVTGASASPSGVPSATTEETETANFIPTVSTTEIHSQPRLSRLSVSLILDESLSTQEVAISESVKAMLGFDSSRKDNFNSMVTKIEPAPVVEEDPDASDQAEPSGLLEMETLIENGVELVSALAFIFLLLKGLKGTKADRASKAKTGAEGGRRSGDHSGGSPSGAPVEVNPELLARAQVDDLVQNNPERVAQILSNWAIEGRSPVNKS